MLAQNMALLPRTKILIEAMNGRVNSGNEMSLAEKRTSAFSVDVLLEAGQTLARVVVLGTGEATARARIAAFAGCNE